MKNGWHEIGQGTFNLVYLNQNKKWVLKIQKNEGTQTDLPERSIRLWNEINDKIPKAYIHYPLSPFSISELSNEEFKFLNVYLPEFIKKKNELFSERELFLLEKKLYLLRFTHKPIANFSKELSNKLANYRKGWICPYVKGVQASDLEISSALIDIFNQTGRIVIDAISPKNFIKTYSGLVVCIDIGMALQLEKRESSSIRKTHIRQPSLTSLQTWHGLKEKYTHYFEKASTSYPKTVNTIKALLFIKSYHPDIEDVSFFKNTPFLMEKLSFAYDTEHLKHDFSVIKQKHLNELNKYIKSIGSTLSGKFVPSWTTRFFRNEKLTQNKVNMVLSLQTIIQGSSSYPELTDKVEQYINILLKNKEFTKQCMSKRIQYLIAQCLCLIGNHHSTLTEISP